MLIMQTKPALAQLVPYIHATYDEMEDLLQRRAITDKVWAHWLTVWQWSVPRHTYIHDAFYRKAGADRYWRRIYRIDQIYKQLLLLRYGSETK
jgi:hypothetical protein